MTPVQARAFLAVATEGSFTAAARRLNLSQPTITSQVAQLEHHYKVELFHRSGRGVRLTGVGSALLPSIRRMFASFDEAVAYLEDTTGLRRGHLRVGSYGANDIMLLVTRYRRRFPAIAVSIDIANSNTLAEKLLRYDLDLAMLDRMDHHPEFQVLPFRTPLLVAIAPRTPPWDKRHSISVEEMRQNVLICREPGSATRAAFNRLFNEPSIAPHQLIQVGSREGMVSAVAAGAGIAAIFDEGLLPEDRVVKLRIAGSAISSRVDVVSLAERRTNQLIGGFLAIAKEFLRETKAPANRGSER
jgi:LysR family transcriptional regulator, low CO2-responsive transcriptional regulator